MQQINNCFQKLEDWLNVCNLQPTHPQGLVSQVDREVLVTHLYHLDLKFKRHNLQGSVNCQVSIYSPF